MGVGGARGCICYMGDVGLMWEMSVWCAMCNVRGGAWMCAQCVMWRGGGCDVCDVEGPVGVMCNVDGVGVMCEGEVC